MKALLEAGVHFGHQTRRWNPQMKRYIFTQRNGIHIIDLQQTLGMINEAYRAMVQVAADGGKVLFVGTKRQAQEVIQSEADRCGMWYVNQRWLGGTLTNFQTIRSRINHMLELQQKRDQGYFRVLPKKEAIKLRDTLARLEKYFTGMRDMSELPRAMFVIDIGKEDICIAEGRRMGLEIFAIVDTDCDPNKVGHVIPGNDDAVRSIRLITSRMATAVLEGLAQREAMLQAEREALDREALEAAELPEDDEITSSSQEELGLDAHVDLEDMKLLEEQMLSAAQSSGEGLEIPAPEMPAVETAPRQRLRKRQPAAPDPASQEAFTGQRTGETTRRALLGAMEEEDSGDFLAEEDDPAAGSA
jgi:small subunit ribosomal protein S2